MSAGRCPATVDPGPGPVSLVRAGLDLGPEPDLDTGAEPPDTGLAQGI